MWTVETENLVFCVWAASLTCIQWQMDDKMCEISWQYIIKCKTWIPPETGRNGIKFGQH
jgi:hypothetical protein